MKPSLAALKQIGIWTGAFERQPASKVREAAAESNNWATAPSGLAKHWAGKRSHKPPCCSGRLNSLSPLELRISMDATLSQWRLGRKH